MRSWRAWVIWGMQSALVALLLLLLWQPAMTIGELSSQQNIIAVVVDDSRSMAMADSNGRTREAAALAALDGGVLAGLEKRFQTRLYRIDRELKRQEGTQGIAPTGTATTHLDDGLKQLRGRDVRSAGGRDCAAHRWQSEHSGAGRIGHRSRHTCRRCGIAVFRCTRSASAAKNSPTTSRSRTSAWRKRRLPTARVAATVTFTQHGYAGQKATLTVRDGDKTLAAREITFGPDGRVQAEPLFFPAGAAGAKSITFGVGRWPAKRTSPTTP